MAGLGGKNWTFQEEVTSSDVNGYLADQVVMRFGGTANRDAGFGGAGEPTLAEGMVSYLDDANRLDFYDGAAWKPISKILQVVSTTKSDDFQTTSTSYTDVTGLSATITPSSTLSKVLVLANIQVSGNNLGYHRVQLVRNSTVINIGDAAGSRSRVTMLGIAANGLVGQNQSTAFLDSPSTTSATTYKIQVQTTTDFGTGTIAVNKAVSDSDNVQAYRSVSSITLFEVAP